MHGIAGDLPAYIQEQRDLGPQSRDLLRDYAAAPPSLTSIKSSGAGCGALRLHVSLAFTCLRRVIARQPIAMPTRAIDVGSGTGVDPFPSDRLKRVTVAV